MIGLGVGPTNPRGNVWSTGGGRGGRHVKTDHFFFLNGVTWGHGVYCNFVSTVGIV